MLEGLTIILIGAVVLSVFPIKDRSSMFGMVVVRSRWIVAISAMCLVTLLVLLGLILLAAN